MAQCAGREGAVSNAEPDAGQALVDLMAATTDFTIHNRDWPRHGIRWEVVAVRFIARGSAVGHTLRQAVDRALVRLERMDDAIPRASLEDLGEY
jgi:hypothetical protein